VPVLPALEVVAINSPFQLSELYSSFEAPVKRCVLKLYFECCERTRTHLSLDKDAPIPRKVGPPELGKVVELLQVGGALASPAEDDRFLW